MKRKVNFFYYSQGFISNILEFNSIMDARAYFKENYLRNKHILSFYENDDFLNHG